MRILQLIALIFCLAAGPVFAQGQGKGKGGEKPAAAPAAKGPKRYAVKTDRALVVTREVLVKQGFVVERVEDKGEILTLWYYRGNMGQGKGRGPLQRMVIRRIDDRVVFEEAPAGILVDIDVKLRL